MFRRRIVTIAGRQRSSSTSERLSLPPMLSRPDTPPPLLAREIAEATGLSLPWVVEKLARDKFPVGRRDSMDLLDPTQRERLIEALLIHETYFFRHPNQWRLLRSELPALVERRPGAPLIAWSAGCSTGEEAWSLAYLLVREGHSSSVIGTDISKSSIATAAHGTYRRLERMGSLREIPDFAAADFPTRAGECWNARPDLHAMTRFIALSLLETSPVSHADIVFCRNVMIYFSPAIVDELIQRIAAIVPEGGILALGGAETLRSPTLFEPLYGDGAYLFRRNGTPA
jgi:chemotaxis protein methyltransferase CheR